MNEVKLNTLFFTLKTHLFVFCHKYLFSTYSVSSTVLGSGDLIVNMADEALNSLEFTVTGNLLCLVMIAKQFFTNCQNLDLDVWMTNFVYVLNIWRTRSKNERSQRGSSGYYNRWALCLLGLAF